MKVRWIAVVLAIFATGAAAQDMKAPRITYSRVDWDAVAATLTTIASLQAAQASIRAAAIKARTVGPADTATTTKLAQLNAATAKLFPNIAASPVPVLMPLDVNAYLRERKSGEITAEARARHLSGFKTPSFFFPGPSGYDAVFTIKLHEIPELADIRYRHPIEVHLSGSMLLYEIDEVREVTEKPVPELEAKFPGIRRSIVESVLRYTFVHFGVPYVTSILCFDGGRPRFKKPTCRSADRIAIHFLQRLHIAGGTPHARRRIAPPTIKRPTQVSQTFSYYSPGWLLRGTGFRGRGGNVDYTAYSRIRFPISKAPAFINSQTFHSRARRFNPYSEIPPNYDYPWRDNFCERRSFGVGQCPIGIGHQGQDIRTPRCTPEPGKWNCERIDFAVAVRDGLIMRAPKQEALYVVVNTADEHIRFRYLHMNPNDLDDAGWFSGRKIVEGEFIGRVSNFSRRQAGTSYHLHFDVQVPTRRGWVFVNPYMTLVAAYEHLIGEHGTEIKRKPPAKVDDNDDEDDDG